MKPIQIKNKMNKLECRWANQLEYMKMAREIIDWRFQSFGIKLADKTYYYPDFFVVFPDHFEVHETKGFCKDDALVKFKTARDMYPWWRWKMLFWSKKTGWIVKYEN